MEIQYRDTHVFTVNQLSSPFLSAEWSSGHDPEKLVTAMQHYETVCSAWDGNTLVGLICAMDDSIMIVYIHYLLVRPSYQGMGIGKELAEKMKAQYADYLRIVLISYNGEIGFYEACGFKRETESNPMRIKELWT